MAYSVTLAKMIANSGLTLQQIAIKCKLYGIEIGHSYISKLQTGKQAPPSDKVSEALAKACGGDPEILLYEGYLEKAPDFVQNLLLGLANFARQTTKALTLPQLPEAMSSMFEQHLDQIPDVELVKQFVDNDILDQVSQSMVLKDYEDSDVKVIVNPLFSLTMQDESMVPIIPKGTRIQTTDIQNIDNGDIVVAAADNGTYLIRRYIRTANHEILVPESKGFEPILISTNEFHIIAKVKSLIIDL